MARELLNTLFVTSPNAFVRLDGKYLKVELDGAKLLQVPMHHIGSVMLFGTSMISLPAIHRCAADGRTITLLDQAGRFKARIVGPTSGNVLLRQAQYEAHRDPAKTVDLARSFVAGKLRNMYKTLMRSAREIKSEESRTQLRGAAEAIGSLLVSLPAATDIDQVRGLEGQASAVYFDVFGLMITVPPTDFAFKLRTRRPPRDRVNAVLSFVYSLLTADCVGACEGVGLDPQFGFLHTLRPGRSSLALDLMEEFRSAFADRLTLTLINRRQLRPDDFDEGTSEEESVLLNSDGRKTVLQEYQLRKQVEVTHELLKEKTPLGLIPHLQARLLARYLREDLDSYIPYSA